MPAYHPQRIEPKWQAYWERHKTFRTKDFVEGKEKLYILDMFPYPSGAGLHVGHPEGYTATDILCRFSRMKGLNVLHPMGWDAFGLPAEQHAIKTGTHPRVNTKENVDNFRRQIKSLGFSYDWDREIDTTDPNYYKWTQWIFLRIHDTWYDPDYPWIDENGSPRRGKGRPIAELPIPPGTADPDAFRDSKRLAYRAEVPVNWCPALGTVLSNEEVKDGVSEIGGHPVTRMPLKQWMLRITSYGERLSEDLESVDWPRAIKDMQRNWIGRSEGATVDFFTGSEPENLIANRSNAAFPESPEPGVIRVFTTRPDTLFGATYMVLAPEHPLVDVLTTPDKAEAVRAYREEVARKSDLDRTDLAKSKTGVFIGSYAVNPLNRRRIPIWIADYVLISYGTGAIMAVPGHDERDFEFAKTFGLEIDRVVAKSVELAREPLNAAEPESGVAVNSANEAFSINGLPTLEAKTATIRHLERLGIGRGAITYKLRDWLFSRQRYWGEPFPVLIDEKDRVTPLSDKDLPVLLPDLDDFRPSGRPEPPLAKASDWVNFSEKYRRETNTMPQWAGSCWYYLRYIDPTNADRAWSRELEKYWLPVDLYVGGAEHAVLHLLYSRFWHKVLFDRGDVSTAEPFRRLVNQGMILGETEYAAYRDESDAWVSSTEVDEVEGVPIVKRPGGSRTLRAVKLSEEQVRKKGEGFVLVENPEIRIDARAFKMSKSRGNVINPDRVIEEYGADSLRLYEMFMGPLEAVKPWSMKGVEGVSRFLGRAWRMIIDSDAEAVALDPRVQDVEPTPEQAKLIARTVAGVTDDFEGMRFNTAISKLMEFVNAFTSESVRPKRAMETFALLLAPLAPHVAEELWETLGHGETLAYEPWPRFDPALLRDDEIEIPVQINGKVRARVLVPAEAGESKVLELAKAEDRVASLLQGKTIRKEIVVPGKLINFVVS